LLRENLDKVEGIKWESKELTDEKFILTVNVDGYDIEIEKNGNVTLKGEINGGESQKPSTPGIEERESSGRQMVKKFNSTGHNMRVCGGNHFIESDNHYGCMPYQDSLYVAENVTRKGKAWIASPAQDTSNSRKLILVHRQNDGTRGSVRDFFMRKLRELMEPILQVLGQ